MDDFMKWFGFSLQILPLVLKGVLLAEDVIGPGNGQAKKALVMGALTAPNMPDEDRSKSRAVASSMIDNTVGALNSGGKLPAHRPASAPGR